jgi:hypothetical protein
MWRVWGNARDPYFEGSESGAKADAERRTLNEDDDDGDGIYIENPDGDEFVFDSGKWELA